MAPEESVLVRVPATVYLRFSRQEWEHAGTHPDGRLSLVEWAFSRYCRNPQPTIVEDIWPTAKPEVRDDDDMSDEREQTIEVMAMENIPPAS